MSFWDDPRNQPSSGAWPAAGTISKLAVLESPRFARLTLCVELDNDGRQRWCSSRLWRAIAESRADVGDHITVTRGPDEPNPAGQPISTWIVQRSSAAQIPAGWSTPVKSGPSW